MAWLAARAADPRQAGSTPNKALCSSMRPLHNLSDLPIGIKPGGCRCDSRAFEAAGDTERAAADNQRALELSSAEQSAAADGGREAGLSE